MKTGAWDVVLNTVIYLDTEIVSGFYPVLHVHSSAGAMGLEFLLSCASPLSALEHPQLSRASFEGTRGWKRSDTQLHAELTALAKQQCWIWPMKCITYKITSLYNLLIHSPQKGSSSWIIGFAEINTSVVVQPAWFLKHLNLQVGTLVFCSYPKDWSNIHLMHSSNVSMQSDKTPKKAQKPEGMQEGETCSQKYQLNVTQPSNGHLTS